MADTISPMHSGFSNGDGPANNWPNKKELDMSEEPEVQKDVNPAPDPETTTEDSEDQSADPAPTPDSPEGD